MKTVSKLSVLSLLLLLLFAGCGKSVEITVENTSGLERKNEIVEFCLCSVEQKLSLKADDKIVILNADNKQVPHQLLSDGKTVIFPACVAANSSAVYRVKIGTPDSIAPRSFGRQVPERKDDFAWENDRIAFRMYGPALAPENPSNGVDMWLKRTDELIIDKWYSDDLERDIHYHVDNGQGLDCYKVAHTLGAGGIAPYVDSVLWVGNHYDKFEIKESGALRTEFTLTYDSLKIGYPKDAAKNIKCVLPQTPCRTVKATVSISLDAGSQLNKAKVVYEGEGVDKMPVAAGFYLHSFGNSNGKNVPCTERKILKDEKLGFIALGEDAVSDGGALSGRSYLGVIIPTEVSQIKEDKGLVCAAPSDEHLIAVGTYHEGHPFVYYFGGGWSKWGFADDYEWFGYVDAFQAKIRQPLRVSVK